MLLLTLDVLHIYSYIKWKLKGQGWGQKHHLDIRTKYLGILSKKYF